MNRTPLYPMHPLHRSTSRPSVFGALEWEELPSLAQTLKRQRLAFAGSVWPSTQRQELFEFDPAPAPAPFAEPINGLHVREIDGSEVFHHFFGQAAVNH